MIVRYYVTFLFLFYLCSCTTESTPELNFYHWKHKAEISSPADSMMKDMGTKIIYLHYFDVVQEDEAIPEYFIRSVDTAMKKYSIVPVVFITNEVVKNTEADQLSKKITKLVNQISKHHFGKQVNSVQIDCDWTESSRKNYFDLLRNLKNNFNVSATLRLHQIKYKDHTGVPPVDHATLMVYNIGDLEDMNQNSILSTKMVEKYISDETSYPIPLNIALPIFSQAVLSNNQEDYRLLKNVKKDELRSDSNHFQKNGNNKYLVIKDTFFHGYYLSEGFQIKVETVNEISLVKTYNRINDSDLEIDEIIFYHLDSIYIEKTDFNKIMDVL